MVPDAQRLVVCWALAPWTTIVRDTKADSLDETDENDQYHQREFENDQLSS